MSEDWSDDELRLCVRQYWKAIKNKGAERDVDRKAFIRAALKESATLKASGEGSVSQRMCNISAVMELNGKPSVQGWKPLRNVGSGVTPRIEAMLREFELI